MRTTVDLDDELLAAARRRAASRATSLTAVIEEALAALLHPPLRPPVPFRLDWPTFGGPPPRGASKGASGSAPA